MEFCGGDLGDLGQDPRTVRHGYENDDFKSHASRPAFSHGLSREVLLEALLLNSAQATRI